MKSQFNLKLIRFFINWCRFLRQSQILFCTEQSFIEIKFESITMFYFFYNKCRIILQPDRSVPKDAPML